MSIFQCTPELADWLEKKGRNILCVEVAQSNTSDIEITEPFLRVLTGAQAEYLITKKRYRSRPLKISDSKEGEVLLAPYHLTMDEVVTFGRKKVLFFHVLTMDGIRI